MIKQCEGNSGKTIETSKQHIDSLDDNREVVIEAFHSINYSLTNSYDDESRLSCSSPTEKKIEPDIRTKERNCAYHQDTRVNKQFTLVPIGGRNQKQTHTRINESINLRSVVTSLSFPREY